MNNRVVHFEIQADDLERAAKFYKGVFGWKIEKWDGGDMEYWMIMTAEDGSKEPGINGGLMKRPFERPKAPAGANAFVCTVVVENFDTTASKILDAGGKVAMEKFPIVGMAWQGYFVDTDGNVFGVHEPDENAK